MLLGWERLFRRGFDSGKNFPIWGAGMMLIVAGFVFYAKYKRRNNGTSPTAQPATAAAEASSIISEERRRQRRELILNSIIQKKVKSKSNVSGEQDIGIDLEQAHPPQQAEEQDMDLSHEEILVTQERSFNSIPDLSIDIAAEQELTNNSTGSYDNGDIVNDDDDGAGIIICTFVDLNRTTGANKQLNVNVNANSSNENDQIHNDDDGDGASIIYASADLVNRKVGANSISTSGFFTNKNDIMIETLRSIRSSLNTAIIDESSLYCPKSCSMCYDNYAKGDDIAWSKNEQCCHAFHTDCIMQWLMNHDDCPM